MAAMTGNWLAFSIQENPVANGCLSTNDGAIPRDVQMQYLGGVCVCFKCLDLAMLDREARTLALVASQLEQTELAREPPSPKFIFPFCCLCINMNHCGSLPKMVFYPPHKSPLSFYPCLLSALMHTVRDLHVLVMGEEKSP